MIKDINVRFFSYCMIDNDVDFVEVTEDQFKELEGVITYERHTIFDNGCKQICLTIEPKDYPNNYDLKTI